MTNTDIATHFHHLNPRYAELAGQVAVVTGGAKGIGQGIALRLAREKMRIVIADMDAEAMAATVTALRDVDVDVTAFHGDLSEASAIERLFDEVQATYGGVDLLVNNAAHLKREWIFEGSDELMSLQLATNIAGPYRCSVLAAGQMRERGGGNIVNISSVGALRAHWRGLPYDVTKGAINSMTQAMALDLAEHRIRVNAIGPGAIQTYRTPPVDHPKNQAVSRRIPLGRFGTVYEIGAVVAFLASAEASYITGQVFYVDGGVTAQLTPRNAGV